MTQEGVKPELVLRSVLSNPLPETAPNDESFCRDDIRAGDDLDLNLGEEDEEGSLAAEDNNLPPVETEVAQGRGNSSQSSERVESTRVHPHLEERSLVTKPTPPTREESTALPQPQISTPLDKLEAQVRNDPSIRSLYHERENIPGFRAVSSVFQALEAALNLPEHSQEKEPALGTQFVCLRTNDHQSVRVYTIVDPPTEHPPHVITPYPLTRTKGCISAVHLLDHLTENSSLLLVVLTFESSATKPQLPLLLCYLLSHKGLIETLCTLSFTLPTVPRSFRSRGRWVCLWGLDPPNQMQYFELFLREVEALETQRKASFKPLFTPRELTLQIDHDLVSDLDISPIDGLVLVTTPEYLLVASPTGYQKKLSQISFEDRFISARFIPNTKAGLAPITAELKQPECLVVLESGLGKIFSVTERKIESFALHLIQKFQVVVGLAGPSSQPLVSTDVFVSRDFIIVLRESEYFMVVLRLEKDHTGGTRRVESTARVTLDLKWMTHTFSFAPVKADPLKEVPICLGKLFSDMSTSRYSQAANFTGGLDESIFTSLNPRVKVEDIVKGEVPIPTSHSGERQEKSIKEISVSPQPKPEMSEPDPEFEPKKNEEKDLPIEVQPSNQSANNVEASFSIPALEGSTRQIEEVGTRDTVPTPVEATPAVPVSQLSIDEGPSKTAKLIPEDHTLVEVVPPLTSLADKANVIPQSIQTQGKGHTNYDSFISDLGFKEETEESIKAHLLLKTTVLGDHNGNSQVVHPDSPASADHKQVSEGGDLTKSRIVYHSANIPDPLDQQTPSSLRTPGPVDHGGSKHGTAHSSEHTNIRKLEQIKGPGKKNDRPDPKKKAPAKGGREKDPVPSRKYNGVDKRDKYYDEFQLKDEKKDKEQKVEYRGKDTGGKREDNNHSASPTPHDYYSKTADFVPKDRSVSEESESYIPKQTSNEKREEKVAIPPETSKSAQEMKAEIQQFFDSKLGDILTSLHRLSESDHRKEARIEEMVKKVIEKLVEERLIRDLKDNFNCLMSNNYNEAFEELIIPCFEKYLMKIFDKTSGVFEKGLKYFNDKICLEERKVNQFRDNFALILNQFSNNSKAFSKLSSDIGQLNKDIVTNYNKDILKRVCSLEEAVEKVSEKQDRILDLVEKLSLKLKTNDEDRKIEIPQRESPQFDMAALAELLKTQNFLSQQQHSLMQSQHHPQAYSMPLPAHFDPRQMQQPPMYVYQNHPGMPSQMNMSSPYHGSSSQQSVGSTTPMLQHSHLLRQGSQGSPLVQNLSPRTSQAFGLSNSQPNITNEELLRLFEKLKSNQREEDKE